MGFMVDVRLLDLFTPKNGDSKYTKRYAKEHAGNYKLYSANTNGEFMLIDSYDYDGDYLTWAKDGLAGYMTLHKNEKFSITGHRSILIQNDGISNICLEYIMHILEPVFRNIVKGRLGDLRKNEYTTLNPQMLIQEDIRMRSTIFFHQRHDGIETVEVLGQDLAGRDIW